jgi:hypothetical protein
LPPIERERALSLHDKGKSNSNGATPRAGHHPH